MNKVNPPGFDVQNALTNEDLIWPLMGREDAEKDTWAPMLLVDRKLSMMPYRESITRHAGKGTVSRFVKAQIDQLHDGSSYPLGPYAIY